MELSGEIVIAASPERVWQALNDPQLLLRCIPGCEEVRRLSEAETHVRVAIKLGPVRARFVGKILMADIRPGAGCTLQFEGSGGAAGFAKGSSSVELRATAEADSCLLRYTAQASVGGKLGQIGGRMIDASAKQMADQFFQALREQLGAPAPAEAAAVAIAASHTPAVTATAGPVAAAGAGEGVRVLWFLLGAASTGFGMWCAAMLAR